MERKLSKEKGEGMDKSEWKGNKQEGTRARREGKGRKGV